jgi:hypothetical protein
VIANFFADRGVSVTDPYGRILGFLDRSLPEKPIFTQLLKNFPTFYGTPKFITFLTRAHHCPLF